MDGAKACVIVNVKELLTNVLGLAYNEVLAYLSAVNHLNLFIYEKATFYDLQGGDLPTLR